MPDRDLRELELSPEAFRSLVATAVEHVVRHLEALPDQPVDGAGNDLAELARFARSLREPLPETGAPVDRLLEDVFRRVVPRSYATTSPGFMAFVPGGGILHAAVAELVANAVNRYVGVWRVAPGLAELEANVVRWFCGIVGYPGSASGVLTTGGSLANLWAFIAARRTRLPEDFLDGVLYASDQVHHSVTKGAVLAGFPARNVRLVPSDGGFRIRLDALERQIARDRREGHVPFLLVGNAGTVNTGAVDDLAALADLAERERLWLHVDAAYGGFFLLTERGRARMRGIDRADSVVLDPHKGLFLPYGTGAVLVKEGDMLKRAFSGTGSYMPVLEHEPDLMDFCELSPELSREWRGLRVWLPIKMHGIHAFRLALDEKLDLAEWAARELEAINGVEVVAGPQLSTLAFRLVRAGLDGERLNALNRELLERINARQRVLLTPTMLGDRYVIRICIVSFRTHLDRVREAVEIVRAAVSETKGHVPVGRRQRRD